MAKLVLHIGAHKTGTSYLQSLFYHNHDLLRSHGVFYPKTGPNLAHHALAAVWIPVSDVPERFFGAAGPVGLWDKLIAEYAPLDGTVFLSAENFSRSAPKAVDMADLAKRLAPFESVQVVYTLRAQTEMMTSLWVQVAKNRKAPSLHSYIDKALNQGMGGGIPLDYNVIYDQLLQGFAPEQITLLDYATFRRTKGGIEQVFLDILGCNLSAADLKPAPVRQANISPDALAQYAASRITKGTVPPPELVERLTGLIRPTPETPTSLLTRTEYTAVNRRFEKANARLVERVQPYQPGFAFSAPPAPENMFYRSNLTERIWAKIAASLYNDKVTPTTGNRIRRLWLKVIDRITR